MFITKLNSFFARHGRKTFAVFTGAIIVSFVLYFSPGFNFLDMIRGAGSSESGVPVILGKKVGEQEIMSNVDSFSIIMSLSSPGFNINNSYMRNDAETIALERIMMLRAASERNIVIGDSEVADYLRAIPAFQKDGKFDTGTFEQFVKQYLTPFRYSKQDLDRAVREQLAVERLYNEIGSGIITTPEEVRQAFNTRFEKFKVKDLKFKAEAYSDKVAADEKTVEAFFNSANSATEEQIRQYYEANKDKFKENNNVLPLENVAGTIKMMLERYRIPAKFKAKFVRFNYVAYEKSVSVTEEKIKQYYDANKDKFKEKEEILPLDKVADKIKNTLSSDEMKILAIKDAQSFAVDAYQSTADLKTRKAVIDGFSALAEKKTLKVYETDFFSSEDAVLKNLGREPEFAMAVSQLFADQPVSDAIQGNNACFVACMTDKEESRSAKFEEVKDKVKNDYIAEKSLLLARENARNAALKISEEVDAGKNIDALLPEFKFEDVPEFDMIAPPKEADGSVILELAAATRTGKVSEVKDTPYGSIFIFVEKKTLPS
ncbi:MAG: SurA N-terminal domain-containing protein, partial [Lentisphaerae bacterium]|nr:SurA N-terminal domain-containing protein [Lentisphaerota bacterium]